MRSFKQFLSEEPKKPKEKEVEFFATLPHRIGDPKHDIEIAEDTVGEEPIEFFAHFKSEKDKKHSIDEGFSDTVKEESKIFSANRAAVAHHSKIKDSSDHDYFVENYTQSSSLNRGLFNREKINDPNTKRKIKHLDDVTNHPENKLTGVVHAYSGIGDTFNKKLSRVKPGKIVSSPGYISTTIKRQVAQKFGAGDFIHFHLPKGYSKGRYIKSKSWFPKEHEFLIARGQKFKYLKKDTRKVGYFNEISTVHHLEPIIEKSNSGKPKK